MDAVREIRTLEESLEQEKARARAQAQAAEAAAQQQGRDLLAQTRRAIREADEAAARETECAAQAAAQELQTRTDEECQALRRTAGEKMDAAVSFLVGKVVSR